MTLESLISRIAAWQSITFPTATPESTAIHLDRESFELLSKPYDRKEIADIFFLLIQLCSLTGIDLKTCVEEKFEENRQREWKAPDSEGVVEHVRPEKDLPEGFEVEDQIECGKCEGTGIVQTPTSWLYCGECAGLGRRLYER